MAPPLVITYGGISRDSIEELRKINTSSFPIQYHERFYDEVADQNDANLSKFAYWRGNIVGAICTRISDADDGDGKKLYIMTLAVYAPYRGRGIGSQLLRSVLDHAEERDVREITLHVHVSNQDAILFYTERFGFERGELLKNYYRRLNPPHCYLLSKHFTPAAQSANDHEQEDRKAEGGKGRNEEGKGTNETSEKPEEK